MEKEIIYNNENFKQNYEKSLDDCLFVMNELVTKDIFFDDLKKQPYAKYQLVEVCNKKMTPAQIKVAACNRMKEIMARMNYSFNMEPYKEKLSKLTDKDWKNRRVYLSKISSGEIYGPSTGLSSIDMPWLKFYDEKYYNADIPNTSIYDELIENVTDVKLPAINYLGEVIIFKTLIEKVDNYAKAFKLNGVKKGDKVSVCLPNVPESVYILYALNKIGATANIIDPRKRNKQLIHAVNEAESKMFVTSDIFIHNTDKIRNKLCTNKIYISPILDSLSEKNKKIVTNKAKEDMDLKDIARTLANRLIAKKYKSISDLEKQGRESDLIVESVGKIDDVASIVYTSGTTGKSKGVELTNKSYIAMVLEYKENIVNSKPGEKILTHVPPFLAYTSILGTHLPLVLNVTLCMYPDYHPERAADIVHAQKIQHVVGGPADWHSFYNNQDIENQDYSHLKTMGSGSDTLTVNVRKTINERLKTAGVIGQIFEGYGLSEASSAVATNLPDYVVDNSVGIPLPLMKTKVVDPVTLEELPYNTKGELFVSGPTVMKEYLNNPDATKDVLFKDIDGDIWLRTGDYFYINEDGNLFYLGRDKEMITLYNGVKVSPVEIEETLLLTPYVKEVCVVAADDVTNGRGGLPIANVVLKEEYADKQDMYSTLLVKFCEKYLPEEKCPRRIIFREKLPKTDVGKIDFIKLTAMCNEELNQNVRIR
ncbi:MAG: acyl--CoA ligase [Bacilli bacterium]|nr:acyl--CoA ligase [Bacilli bacterium]